MKKLIVAAVDFSEGSMGALHYAIQIANKIHANVMMVWVDKSRTIKTVYKDAYDPRLEAKRRFEDIIEKYGPELTGGTFSYKIRNGKVYNEIVNQAKYHDASLILAGTHGTSGFEEFWIGSNAYKIVTYSPCPIITIRKDDANVRPFKNIVLPIDSTRQTRQKVPFTCTLAKAFGATLNVVSMYSSKVQNVRDMVDSYAEQTIEYIADKDIAYTHTTLEAENLTDGAIEYAKSVDADLISIMTEQETSTANLLLGPYAQQMVNHSSIPVLSIRNKSIYDHQTK
jgi:nucleotide-binding universal stress UspA family protein